MRHNLDLLQTQALFTSIMEYQKLEGDLRKIAEKRNKIVEIILQSLSYDPKEHVIKIIDWDTGLVEIEKSN